MNSMQAAHMCTHMHMHMHIHVHMHMHMHMHMHIRMHMLTVVRWCRYRLSRPCSG